jgi:hypothetical protein
VDPRLGRQRRVAVGAGDGEARQWIVEIGAEQSVTGCE